MILKVVNCLTTTIVQSAPNTTVTFACNSSGSALAEWVWILNKNDPFVVWQSTGIGEGVDVGSKKDIWIFRRIWQFCNLCTCSHQLVS